MMDLKLFVGLGVHKKTITTDVHGYTQRNARRNSSSADRVLSQAFAPSPNPIHGPHPPLKPPPIQQPVRYAGQPTP